MNVQKYKSDQNYATNLTKYMDTVEFRVPIHLPDKICNLRADTLRRQSGKF